MPKTAEGASLFRPTTLAWIMRVAGVQGLQRVVAGVFVAEAQADGGDQGQRREQDAKCDRRYGAGGQRAGSGQYARVFEGAVDIDRR